MDGLGGAREWEGGTGRTEGDTDGMVLVPGDREGGSAKPVGGRDLTLGPDSQPGKRECQPRWVSQGSRTSGRRVRHRPHSVSPHGGPEGPGKSWGTGVGRQGREAKKGGVCTCNLHQEEKQAAVLGLNKSWEHVSTELRDYVRHQEARLEWALGLLHVLFSCTFLLVLRA